MERDLSLWHSESLTLWVLHADKIPPHIGISDHTGFYSLKVKGKDEGLNLEKVLELVYKKSIPTLLYTLSAPGYKSLEEVFDRYDRASANGDTCLSPISDILEISNSNTIHELLSVLETRGLITATFQLNTGVSFDGIKHYTKDAIVSRLKLLES
ncbi:MAG: hypothetical protein EP333_04750 [Bacteroidetes bacterium]|nr:MAG: hypothetical protein EP333_04750 [Bacteroidota bacterium]TNE96994.1 MAG: hypothetical protein EP322_07450 [Bacteroidota bacterium]